MSFAAKHALVVGKITNDFPLVVARAVGAGVAGAQHPRRRLAAAREIGAVEVGQQRVKPEPPLKHAGRAVLGGMRGDQRAVEVNR